MAEMFKTLVNYWVAIQSGTNAVQSFWVNIYPMLVVAYFTSLIAFIKSYKDELRELLVYLMKGTFKGLAKLINLFS